MRVETRHYYTSPTDAVDDVFYHRTLGYRVGVGRDAGDKHWHVRIIGKTSQETRA